MKLACVFGQVGNEALIVTYDDDVFAVGSNGAGCHGIGNPNFNCKISSLDGALDFFF